MCVIAPIPSNVLVDERVLWNIPRVKRAGDDQFAVQRSAKHHFHDVDEILLRLEAANELRVVRCAA